MATTRRGHDQVGDTDTQPRHVGEAIAFEEVAGVAGERARQLTGVADEHAGRAVCAVVVGVGNVGAHSCGADEEAVRRSPPARRTVTSS
jgi:hypothetical protein